MPIENIKFPDTWRPSTFPVCALVAASDAPALDISVRTSWMRMYPSIEPEISADCEGSSCVKRELVGTCRMACPRVESKNASSRLCMDAATMDVDALVNAQTFVSALIKRKIS